MPLHGWLPAAMVAPTPVSALLHAVAVVKAGTFGCVRLIHYVFGLDVLHALGADMVLAGAAGATVLLASLRAFGESHLKRRLAYSTVSQLSYIVLGAVLGSPAALAGAMFHMVAHGCMKITLFFCAGAIDIQTHRLEIATFAGLGRQMPITFGAFTLGALGLAGTPLLVGFISKWQLGVGAIEAGHAVFLGILVLSGLLNVAYFVPLSSPPFSDRACRHAHVREARALMWVPLALTALLSLVLGLVPNAGLDLYHLAWQAAGQLMAGAPPLAWQGAGHEAALAALAMGLVLVLGLEVLWPHEAHAVFWWHARAGVCGRCTASWGAWRWWRAPNGWAGAG